MTLQFKTFLIISLTLIGLFIILYNGARDTVLSNFEEAEQEQAWKSGHRAGAAFTSLLEDTAAEFDKWISRGQLDDTGIAELVREGATDVASIWTLEGELLNGRLRHSEDLNVDDLADSELTTALREAAIAVGRGRQIPAGVLNVSNEVFLLAGRLTDGGSPAQSGKIVALSGRRFDGRDAAAMERTLLSNVTVHRATGEGVPSRIRKIIPDLAQSGIMTRVLTEEKLASYTLINDIYDLPALVLQVDTPRVGYRQAVRAKRMLLWSFLLSGLALALIILRLLQSQIIARVLSLGKTVSEIAESADASRRVEVSGGDELADLAEATNSMLESLEQSKNALSESLEVVQRTREQLVQAEKMAALGELVAGVAHEINTPVGVSVTAASNLDERVGQFEKRFQEGSLKKSDLEGLLALTRDTSSMILGNLERAAELIRSFKQVAVDQSSEDRRTFNVKDYLEEIRVSLSPEFKKTKHEIVIDCPDDLVVESYPGPLSQVVTNLVMNSVKHAFDDIESGRISIEVVPNKDSFKLIYKDNGRGVDCEKLDRLFDPFFTTKRGEGGSGLGLHIVYNLVTQAFGGTIRCESTLGQGISFDIEIPINVGDKGG